MTQNKNSRRYARLIETGAHVVTRGQLKQQAVKMSDAELLADAVRQAEQWENEKKWGKK